MIDNSGFYKCDYCGGRNGEFRTDTGNHTTCQDIHNAKTQLTRANEIILMASAAHTQDEVEAVNSLAREYCKDFEVKE